MRCYFMRDGNIASFEELLGLSDGEARDKAYQLFFERKDGFDGFEGFELWDGTRMITQHPNRPSALKWASAVS
jgi:hypothetical protein